VCKELVVLDGNCAIGCACGKDWLGYTVQCYRLWLWKELVVLDGNYAVGCGFGTVWLG
jgi:hypothetical protein